MCPRGPSTLCTKFCYCLFIWCDLYSMTITFLALVSLLPQQLTKLHQLAMQQTPFPPLGQTTPAFPGTYPAALSHLLSSHLGTCSFWTPFRAVSRAGTALVNTWAGGPAASLRPQPAILWRDVGPPEGTRLFSTAHRRPGGPSCWTHPSGQPCSVQERELRQADRGPSRLVPGVTPRMAPAHPWESR